MKTDVGKIEKTPVKCIGLGREDSVLLEGPVSVQEQPRTPALQTIRDGLLPKCPR